MNYFELKIKVKLKKDIEVGEVAYKIGVFINNSMLNNPVLRKFHEEKVIKRITGSVALPDQSDLSGGGTG